MGSAAIERALKRPAQEVGVLLLSADEDQWFDRKSARVRARALADVLIGFANADGGTVVVGLSEGRVEGTDHLGGRRNELLQASVDFCVPPVRAPADLVPCVTSDGGAEQLLVFDVSPSDGVVHANTKDEVFLRVGDETRRLTFAQRQELAFDRGHESYEVRPLRQTSIADTDPELIASYTKRVGGSESNRVMQARGLVADGRLTVAGGLLFARHPQTWLPEAFVRVLRYQGRERGSGARQLLSSDDRFEGPIPEAIVAARDRIAEMQPARHALASSGRFEDVPLVPRDAWLEGLVNAVIHRSYSLAGDHIRVEIFDDRIEISSPGRFPGIVNLSDPLHAPRFARNPRIARVCADLDFGQERGEGIRRIYEEMQLAGLQEPIYRQTAASVRLILSGEPTDLDLDAQLTPEARVVSVALRDAGRLSTGEIVELLGRSRPYTLRILKWLETAGVIRWVGKSPRDPRAHWELVPR
jgi:ATP-dependent DNA helicase RecG